uniref:Uncharacterized protein n=1 Tax=Arundo donax TaxID=35708 RepID=A0A0A9A2W8_ARUDO
MMKTVYVCDNMVIIFYLHCIMLRDYMWSLYCT